MPDHIEPIATVGGQTDWPAMLYDLEKRVEVLSDALEGVKLSMRRLVLAEPWLEQATESVATQQPQHPAHTEPGATESGQSAAYETQPADYGASPVYHAAPSYSFEPPAAEVDPPVVETASQPGYDQDAREAVRRAVEDAKAQMASGDLREKASDFVTDDKPEVSWVTVPDDGFEPEPLPIFAEPMDEPTGPGAVEALHQPEETAGEAEDSHEAVRRAVEQMKADMASGNVADEDLAPGLHILKSEPVESSAEEPEDPHEAVRRAVEQTKADLGMPGYATPRFEAVEGSTPDSFDDDEAAREAVRRAVEEAKADRSFAENAIGTMDEEEAAREAVRQAVARARTEMATTGSISAEEPPPVVKAPAFVVPPPHRAERVHPPTITIEDPEGRVELARVYNLLKRLDVAANSSLLNYSARQVAVQLSDSKVAPEGDSVGDAVRDVFERENDVSVDGLNVIVKLGDDYVQAA